MSTDELPTRFAVEFFVLRVAQHKKAKDFLPTSYIQGQEVQEAKEAVESARAGLSQKRKEKRKTKEGGLSPQEGDVKKRKEKRKTKEGGLSPQEGDVEKKKKKKRPRKARRWLPRRQGPCALNQEFLFWFTSIWVLRDPSRLKYRLLRDFYARKPCVKKVPEADYFTQRKQYLKRTTLRTY